MELAPAHCPTLNADEAARLFLTDHTRDGTPVVIRAITPEDKYEMRDIYPTLSERTLYMRFFRVISAPSLEAISRYTDVDFDTHLALVVLWGPEQRMVAAGRLIRATADSDVAELSCLVIDEMQHRGIGRVLVRQLLETGREWGVNRVIALVHAENHAMLKLLKTQGYPTELVYDEGEFTVTLDTHLPPTDDNDINHATVGAMHQGIEA
ncbi:GNAT family N-acetyltransferase [Ferrimonas balearica]|nr:GNAT family N-acetyltransferase [Ferrimonas balearica]MBY6016314.1 GNAT family N-acetyltransferase [Halomonas denitrificans]MBW3138736.1 GNAT family N-acetyltransferase [Ferrimonas balearica]MBW3163658.1 GNAT family N-acetyltransferase [Ferrimonas balearica]MBY5979530.1 GNAT family N-acetyltransferase [Ferrimonas balearica]MBY6095416.1 GNAT family N-acetyltransferase [Ferrimonas balearica]